MKDRMTRFFTLCLLVGLAILAACLDTEEVEGTSTDDSIVETEEGSVLVVTTDYASGSYAVVDAKQRTALSNIRAIHSDAVCRFDPITGNMFVLTRLGGDALAILAPENGWTIAEEHSVGAGSNPHDLAVVSKDLAFVTLFGSSTLLALNPLTGKKQKEIDLSSYADADGNPEAEGVLYVDGKVYVTLQRLDESFSPAQRGGLLVVDPATFEVEKALDLTAGNPTGRLRYSELRSGLVLIESGAYGALDGGVESYDLDTGKLSGLIVTEKALGGDVVDVVIVSERIGYAVIGTSAGTTKLVSFDPTAGTLTEELIASEGWDLYYLEVDPKAMELWVADRTPQAPGIRIFDAGLADELTDEPIGVGLPPFMMCFAR
ncbi:MAG: hypothetical protein MUC50_01160 [Myxococcota bacterium]|jgi:outer membrane protein assembly factor BamB|nr:hypothetical protein [Myxococcota bacterium]